MTLLYSSYLKCFWLERTLGRRLTPFGCRLPPISTSPFVGDAVITAISRFRLWGQAAERGQESGTGDRGQGTGDRGQGAETRPQLDAGRINGSNSGTIAQYVDVLCQEICLTPFWGAPLTTVFFGGGTPRFCQLSN